MTSRPTPRHPRPRGFSWGPSSRLRTLVARLSWLLPTLGIIIIAGQTQGARATAAGDGGPRRAHAVSPWRSEARRALLNGCVVNGFYGDFHHWVCPEAPPS